MTLRDDLAALADEWAAIDHEGGADLALPWPVAGALMHKAAEQLRAILAANPDIADSEAISDCSASDPQTHKPEPVVDVETLADFAKWMGDSAEDAEWNADAYLHHRRASLAPSTDTAGGEPS